MNGLPVDDLEEAEALIVDGRFQEARLLLASFLRSHAESAEGWFLLSFAAPERARQVECLERSLKIDPQMSRASLRLAQLSQPAAPPDPVQTSPENPPKVSPFFDNDFDFSDEGVFQPAPQAPKSWFDDLQAPQLVVPVEDTPRPAPASDDSLQPEPQEAEEEPEAPALAEEVTAAEDDQFSHLPEVEELVDSALPEGKPEAGQLTRDQKIWLWVMVAIFFLVLLSLGILYIANLAILPTVPPAAAFIV